MPSERPSRRMADIVFYVSSHGYGHAVRQGELVRTLMRLAPDLRIEVRSHAPDWLFEAGVRLVDRTVDVGVVQRETFRVEQRETLARYAALITEQPAMLDAEAAELREGGVRLIVADVPSAAFEIASRAGVPGVGVTNFSWDWIYEPYVAGAPEYAPVLDHLRAQYARADLLLRLPFHGDLSCFPIIQDIPLIARRSSGDRVETRRRLGLPLDVPVVLISFGSFPIGGQEAGRLAELPYAFVATRSDRGQPAGSARNLFVLPPQRDAYIDLVAACDAVVTKLGYGIVADCLANRVPILYASRGDFREEPILDDAVARLGRAVRIPLKALWEWDLGPYLESLLRMERPWNDLRLDGAEVAAGELLARLRRSSA